MSSDPNTNTNTPTPPANRADETEADDFRKLVKTFLIFPRSWSGTAASQALRVHGDLVRDGSLSWSHTRGVEARNAVVERTAKRIEQACIDAILAESPLTVPGTEEPA